MSDLKKDLRFYSRAYKINFIVLTIIALINVGINFVLASVENSSFQIRSTNLSSLGMYEIIFVIFPFTNQYNMFPYYIAMGGTRKGFLKNSLLFNFIAALLVNIILTFVIINEKFGISTDFISKFVFYYPVCVGFTVLAIGVCTFIASIFYKKGVLYGFASILFMLSPMNLFYYPIANYLLWEGSLIVIALVAFIIGVIFIPASWIFIRKAELK